MKYAVLAVVVLAVAFALLRAEGKVQHLRLRPAAVLEEPRIESAPPKPQKTPKEPVTVATLRKAEEDLRVRLETAEPLETADLLRTHRSPILTELLLRRIDEGLAQDRETWECALFLAIEASEDDPRVAFLAVDRIRDEEIRGDVARFLMKKAGRQFELIGRYGGEEAREYLWSRLPDSEIGLGYVVEPADAPRLESLGLTRALERLDASAATPRSTRK